MKWLHTTLLIPLQVKIKYSKLLICLQVKIKYGNYYRANLINNIRISYLSSRSGFQYPIPLSPMKLNVRIFFSFPWTSHSGIWCCQRKKYHGVISKIFPRCPPYSLTCIWVSVWSSRNSEFQYCHMLNMQGDLPITPCRGTLKPGIHVK